MMDNYCDFCLFEAKSDLGLRIHFGKVHCKAQCEDDKHIFGEFDVCTKENCGMHKSWVQAVPER